MWLSVMEVWVSGLFTVSTCLSSESTSGISYVIPCLWLPEFSKLSISKIAIFCKQRRGLGEVLYGLAYGRLKSICAVSIDEFWEMERILVFFKILG